MSFLICIIGVDGSGKTTQAKELLNALRKRNIPSKYVWLRFFHFFSLPVLMIMKVFKLSYSNTTASGKRIGYHTLWKSPLISMIYQMALILDIFLYKFFKIDIPRKIFNKTIVCDRFIFDTIVDLMISTRNANFQETVPGSLLSGMVPKDTITFFLRTDYDILVKRRDDIKADLNLMDRINHYDELAKYFHFIPIDAGDLEINISQNIIKELQNEQIIQ